MNWTLAKAIELLDDLEKRNPTKEELDKDPIPIYDIVIAIQDKEAVQHLVGKYSRSAAWIIPYNLAAVVSHNDVTFSTPLFVSLLSDHGFVPGHDILVGYLSNLDAHIRKNPDGLKQNATPIREFIMTTALYTGYGDGVVRIVLYQVLRNLHKTSLLRKIFSPAHAPALRDALAQHQDSDDQMMKDRDNLVAIINAI